MLRVKPKTKASIVRMMFENVQIHHSDKILSNLASHLDWALNPTCIKEYTKKLHINVYFIRSFDFICCILPRDIYW